MRTLLLITITALPIAAQNGAQNSSGFDPHDLSGPQQPNPFVITEDAYAAFLNVMSECAQVQLLRKGN